MARSTHGRPGPAAPHECSSSDESLDLLEVEVDAREEGDLLELEDASRLKASIKVVGIGGGGGNALDSMITGGLHGVQFVAANTDAQALRHNRAPLKIQLGAESTRGLGCGANPELGKAAALEARERIRDLLEDTDMVFVTAGLGGGTGTGGAPVVAEIAREIGALTVAVVTKPFQFEGRIRSKHAERGLDELHRVVDTLITIPNHRLLALAGRNTAMTDAFQLADEVLFNAVKGISDLITVHGLINLDFADVRTIMNEMGMALMGTGVGTGENRAVDAAGAAISSPLLEDLSIDGARGVLINITGPEDTTLFEVNEASTLVQEAAHEDANIIFGAVVDPEMPKGEMRVTVIATGLDDGRARRSRDLPRSEEYANVTPLRPEAPASRPADAPAVGARGGERQVRRDAPERLGGRPDALGLEDDFVSPFEDELDVPTFIRRKQGREAGNDAEDRDSPAFLRRSAD